MEDTAEGDLLALLSYLATASLHTNTLRSGRAVLPERLTALLRDEALTQQGCAVLANGNSLRIDGSTIAAIEVAQRSVRDRLNPKLQELWICRAVSFVLEVFPEEAFYDHRIPACDVLIPHGLAAVGHAEVADVAHEEAGTLLNQLGLYLYGRGDAAEAERCYHRSIVLGQKALGEGNETVGIRWNNLGAAHLAQSNGDKARSCFENAVAVLGSAKGRMDSSLALPLSNLYKTDMEMEDWEGARRACGDAMELYMKIYAYYHPLVAECANSLGIIWQNLGKFEKAHTCFEKAVLSATDYAKTPPETLATYKVHLGICRLKEGEARAAELDFRAALELLTQADNAKHGAKAQAYDGLAQALRQEDRPTEAQSAFEYAVQLFELDGDTHATSASLRRLGRLLEQLKESDRARECYERMQQIYRPGTPSKERDAARGLFQLGRLYEKEKRAEEALACYEKMVSRHEASDCLDDETQGLLFHRLSRCLHGLDRYSESAHWMKRTSAVHKRLHGPDHITHGRDAYYLGLALIEEGEELAGLAHLQEAHRVYELNLGPDDPSTKEVARRLGG